VIHDSRFTNDLMRAELTRQIHAIEEAYEFMLAYAAQGLPGDAGAASAVSCVASWRAPPTPSSGCALP
jgi:hypothetical protein